MTSYEEIYQRAARRITDFDMAQLSDDDLEEVFYGYLIGATANFRKCKNDLSDRDDELRQFNTDLLDIEKEILAIIMVRQWLQPQLNSVLLTAQVFSDKETKYYSQSAHLAELRALDESLRLEAQKLARDYTYSNNEYLGGI